MSVELGSDVPQYVSLNVGGSKYVTLLSTLTKHEGSMLEAMFRGLLDAKGQDDGTVMPSFTLARDGEGAYVIDRDGPSFRYVLNYLRNDSPIPIPVPPDPAERKQLAMEAEYYMLGGLLDLCRSENVPVAARAAAAGAAAAAGGSGDGVCTVSGRQQHTKQQQQPVTSADTVEPAQQHTWLHPMTLSELLVQPRVEWAVQLPPTDLRAVSMAYQNYDSSVLRECDLRGIDMRECTLSRAQLQGARLTGTDMRRCNLYQANLSNADMSGAHLAEANLSLAQLRGASFTRACLVGADLSDVIVVALGGSVTGVSGGSISGEGEGGLEGVSFVDADLQGANLAGTSLNGANKQGARLLRLLRLSGACVGASMDDRCGNTFRGAQMRCAQAGGG